MPRYTLCPFYVDENKKTISCEDVIRRFSTYHAKNKYMDKYCDKAWESCPFAVSLTEMYQRIDDGSDEVKEVLTHKVKALEKENKKLISLLGRCDVKIMAMSDEMQKLKGGDTENVEKHKKECPTKD